MAMHVIPTDGGAHIQSSGQIRGGFFVHSAMRVTSSGESFFGELTAFDTGKTSSPPSLYGCSVTAR